MIICDLNYMEDAQEQVTGGFKVKIESSISLAPFSSSATAGAIGVAAPYFVDGASTAGTSTVALAGIPAGVEYSGGFFFTVGSYASSSSFAATTDFF